VPVSRNTILYTLGITWEWPGIPAAS
jgi:hypothetical protein